VLLGAVARMLDGCHPAGRTLAVADCLYVAATAVHFRNGDYGPGASRDRRVSHRKRTIHGCSRSLDTDGEGLERCHRTIFGCQDLAQSIDPGPAIVNCFDSATHQLDPRELHALAALCDQLCDTFALDGLAAKTHDQADADIRVARKTDEGTLRESDVVADLATSVLVDHGYGTRLADQSGGLIGADD
jgi:hypothetical protein